jgi:hypothetical protein
MFSVNPLATGRRLNHIRQAKTQRTKAQIAVLERLSSGTGATGFEPMQ